MIGVKGNGGVRALLYTHKGEYISQMPEKKKPETDESLLVSVAKTIGHAAGKLSVKAGLDSPPESQKTAAKPKIGKLPPKNKSRLPRREKKRLQKTTASRV